MIDSAALLADLKAQLKLLQADLRARAEDADDRVGRAAAAGVRRGRAPERTGRSWMDWRDNEVDQAAVAWIIATTFVRFCEDNDLLVGARHDGAPSRSAGSPGPGDRTARAEENLTAYFRDEPHHNRRDWLQQAFRVLAAQPAGRALVDPEHNPVWTARDQPRGGDGARRRSGAAPTPTARWSTTSPTPTSTPASSATSTRTCPSTRRRRTRCCRRRCSSRSSSSTGP